MKENKLHLGMTFQSQADRDFVFALLGSFIFYACLVSLIHFVKVPERPREDFKRIPPHIAKLILEVPKPPPAIKLLEPAQTASVAPKAQESPKKDPPVQQEPKQEAPKKAKEPEQVSAPPPTQQEARLRLEQEARALQQRNREIAMQSGLLRLLTKEEKGRSSLKEMTGGKDLEKVFSPIQGLEGLQKPPEAEDRTSSRVIQANGSGGIDNLIAMLKEQEGGIKTEGVPQGLGEKRVTQIESPIEIKGTGGDEATRSYESIREVVDSLTGWIRFIYNRALRENPTLRGTITLEFEIIPNGDVVTCRVVTSSVNDRTLEDQLIRRFLQLKFPEISEGINTVIYPITLVPSG